MEGSFIAILYASFLNFRFEIEFLHHGIRGAVLWTVIEPMQRNFHKRCCAFAFGFDCIKVLEIVLLPD